MGQEDVSLPVDMKSQNTVSGLGCGQSFLEEGDDHYNLQTMSAMPMHTLQKSSGFCPGKR